MKVGNVLEYEKPLVQTSAAQEDTCREEPLFSDKSFNLIRKGADCFAHFYAAFLLGTCELPFSVFPLGTAMILCTKKFKPYVFIGVLFACLGYGSSVISGLCVNILAFIMRFLFDGQQKHQKLKTSFISQTAFAIAVGTAYSWAGYFSSESVLKGVFYAVTLSASCLILSAISKKHTRRVRRIFFDGVFFGAAALFTYCLSGTRIGILSPQLLFCFLCIIFASHKGGSVCGLCTGAVTGIAAQEDFYGIAVALALSGYLAGLLSEKYKKIYFCAVAFFTGFCTVYLCLSRNITTPFTTAAVAVLLYFPLSEILPKRSSFPFARTTGNVFFKKSTSRDMRLSEALSSVSQITYNISDKLKYPSEAEVRDEVSGVLCSFCEDCHKSAVCGKDMLCDSKDAIDTICTRLMSGGFLKTDLPEGTGERCIMLDEISNKLTETYSKLIYDRFRDNKTEILASEYSSMARLIKYTSQKTIADTLPDEALQKAACSALCAVGIRFSHVEAYGEREKVVLVHGTTAAGFPCSASEFSAYMSKKCGILFEEPEFLGISEGSVMRLKRKPCLRVEYARGARAKGGGKLNGDTVGFFETDEKYFYALISDGMGSGRSAALTSRLTSVFIEKLLTTGSHKNVTLELLNNLLLSKSDESFATVDLLEIDLFTGQACFVKAGAAPAYVLRSSKLYKIASCTPPAGIVRYFNAENTKFVLEKGDMVVMLSDGIVQSSDDVPWLCEMLGADTDESPSQITEKIIEKARRMNLRDDDMTCVAVRVL